MREDKRERALRTQSIPKLLLKMSGPAIVAMLVMSLYNFVDAIFMGMLGTHALGAATIGYPYFIFLTSLGLMLGIGGASYQSRLMGARQKDQAEKTVAVVIISGIALGLITTALTAPFPGAIARVCGATDDLLALSSEYIFILALGAVFPVVSMCLNNLLRGEGSALYSLIGMGIGSILNIALDPLFMFTFGLGVKGAAIATVISQAVGFFILISYYLRRKTVNEFHFRQFKPSREIYREILKIGVPAFLQQLLTTVVASLMNYLGGNIGDYVVAAVGGFNRIIFLGFAVIMGFGQGLQPVIGYNYGAQQFHRVKKAIWTAVAYAGAFCTLLGVACLVFPESLARVFSDDPLVISTIGTGLYWFGWVWPVSSLFFVFQTLFGALGKSPQAIALSVTRQGIFLIAFLFILTPLLGATGLMSSFAAATLLASVLAVALFIPVYRGIQKHAVQPEAAGRLAPLEEPAEN